MKRINSGLAPFASTCLPSHARNFGHMARELPIRIATAPFGSGFRGSPSFSMYELYHDVFSGCVMSNPSEARTARKPSRSIDSLDLATRLPSDWMQEGLSARSALPRRRDMDIPVRFRYEGTGALAQTRQPSGSSTPPQPPPHLRTRLAHDPRRHGGVDVLRARVPPLRLQAVEARGTHHNGSHVT